VTSELLENSADAAQRAIEHYLDGDTKRFVIEAAVSTELLGKACLARIHPVLIAENDFDSLLALCGHASAKPLWAIRTIGAKEVIKRVSTVLAQFRPHANGFEDLANLRNSLVHIGQISPTEVDRTFDRFAAGSEVLIAACQASRDAHWGRFGELVTRVLDASLAAAQRSFARRVERSRAGFLRRYGHLNDQQRVAALAFEMPHAMTALMGGRLINGGLKPCPSCGQPGLVKGELTTVNKPNPEITNPAVLDREPWLAEITEGTLTPTSFICPFCDLTIDDSDELVASGLAVPETHVYVHHPLTDDADADGIYVTAARRADLPESAFLLGLAGLLGQDKDAQSIQRRQEILAAWRTSD
jgi:hypothetical protein